MIEGNKLQAELNKVNQMLCYFLLTPSPSTWYLCCKSQLVDLQHLQTRTYQQDTKKFCENHALWLKNIKFNTENPNVRSDHGWTSFEYESTWMSINLYQPAYINQANHFSDCPETNEILLEMLHLFEFNPIWNLHETYLDSWILMEKSC